MPLNYDSAKVESRYNKALNSKSLVKVILVIFVLYNYYVFAYFPSLTQWQEELIALTETQQETGRMINENSVEKGVHSVDICFNCFTVSKNVKTRYILSGYFAVYFRS